MEPHQTVVSAALAAKSSAEVPKNACCEVRSKVMGRDLLSRNCDVTITSLFAVLVVAAPPDARLISTLGGAVEPLICAPETVQAARGGRIGGVEDAVLLHKGAHARPVADVRGSIRSAHSCGLLVGLGGSRPPFGIG